MNKAYGDLGNNAGLLVRSLFAVSVVATLFYGVLSDGQLPDWRWMRGYNDLILHASAFSALTFLGLLIFTDKFLMVLALVVFGFGIEFLQIFEPHRNASFDDLLANILGIIVGLICWFAMMGIVILLKHRSQVPTPTEPES